MHLADVFANKNTKEKCGNIYRFSDIRELFNRNIFKGCKEFSNQRF